jgi:hypothetical protein
MGGVDPAVPTLLGVLLGGGMASGTSFYLERMRAVRDATAAAKRERGDARGAARLLAGSSSTDADSSIELERRATTPGAAKAPHPAAAWTEYRADFALVASNDEWERVAAAFGEFDRLNWHLSDVIEEER